MSLPISTIKTLNLAGVNYTIYPLVDTPEKKAQPAPPVDEQVVLVLLSDCIGKMQCVFTKDRFMDISGLCETLGRNLKGLSSAQNRSIFQTFGLESNTSIPGTMNLPTVIDKNILSKDSLYFHSGNDSLFIHIQGKTNIQRLFSQSDQLNITKSIQDFTPHAQELSNQDEAQINTAVENFTTLRIKQRLESTLEIPPMPDTGKKIIQLRVDPDAGVMELTSVVETDPSLAAQVVSWASSPYYAAPGKINSVQDAIMRVLGFDLVINLGLGLSLGKALELPSDCPVGMTPYWKQAVYSAAVSELLARKIGKHLAPEPGLAYLSGLLHNFGYVILGHVFPPHLLLINRCIEANPHVDREIIEFFILGISSNQIAAWLFKLWSMPEEVSTAVRWQNQPDYSGKYPAYPHLLNMTNEILKHHAKGSDQPVSLNKSLMEGFNLDQETINEAVKKIWDNLDHLDAIAKNLEK